MMASEIAVYREARLRRVGVRVPTGRSPVGLAVGLYQDLGIDVEIADRTISVAVGRALAWPVQGALERYTGIPAFNEWDAA